MARTRESKMAARADVLLVTVTKVETQAVIDGFGRQTKLSAKLHAIEKKNYHFLGIVNGARVWLVRSEMGSGGLGAAHQTVQKAIASLRPGAVVMVGIAFGINPKKQAIGDILVSTGLRLYEPQRVGAGKERGKKSQPETVPRGARPDASSWLLDSCRTADLNWKGAKVHFGLVLTGEKLIDNGEFRQWLTGIESEAIGGEMEGAGLYTACHAAKADWILVKAICDWADGKKGKDKQARQKLAAGNAAQFVLQVVTKVRLEQGAAGQPGDEGDLDPARTTGESEARTHYLQRLRRQCLNLPLMPLGDNNDSESTLTLEDVYIDLQTETQVPLSPVEKKKKKGALHPGMGVDREESRPLTALEAASKTSRLVLLGLPGAGKSSFVQRLLARIASFQLGELKNALHGTPADLLPVLVVLRDLAPRLAALQLEGLPDTARKECLSGAVLDLAVENLTGLEAASFAPALRTAVESGLVLLVFDGLDEVPFDQQSTFRQAVAATLSQFRPERVIVTCRIRSYEGEARLPQFEAHTIAPFTEEQIGRFVKGWYQAQTRHGRLQPEAAGAKAKDLAAAARARELRELAGNPMLLTTMALIHQRETKLPNQRVELYNLAVEVLVQRWEKGKIERLAPFLSDRLKVRAALERLAFEAHRAGKGEQPLGDLERGLALTILEDPKYIGREAAGFLDHVDQRAGILVGRGGAPGRPQVYSFPHRTFQEYLAGCHLLSGRGGSRAFYERAAEGQYWSLAVKLAAEQLYYIVPNARDEKLPDLAYGLCPCEPPATIQDYRANLWSASVALLLGVEAIQLDDSVRDGGQRYLERLHGRLETLLTSKLTAVERAEAGQMLAVLGDSRLGVGLSADGRPDITWIDIGPGEFLMGGDEKLKFQRRLVDKPYRISRYPITVAQYEAFVKAKGYEKQQFWTKAGWKWRQSKKISGPENYDVIYQTGNHPRVGVSWYEAVAFCRWLSEKLEMEVRLPSEAEWERAARHRDGRTYPWGNEDEAPVRCNMGETGIGRTCTVGLFRDGQAQSGAEDMAGNVWEWCCTKWLDNYQKYEKKVDDGLEGDKRRVLRGGAFYSGRVLVRCAGRYGVDPYYRNDFIGFRVVASPFLSSER